jgi:carbonic anhydrase
MMDFPKELLDGYRAWHDERLPAERGRLAQLARLGQAPQALIISCCDSRVAPETVFSVGPGEMFVVRNVANLVPPYQPDGDYHSTSAAIEFAVTGLSVPHIVILGHTRCGGVGAYLQGAFSPEARGEFIGRWMDLVEGSREEALAADPNLEGSELAIAVERVAIRRSLANLRTFPEIARREAAGSTSLHGAHIDIATGELFILDKATDTFVPAVASVIA